MALSVLVTIEMCNALNRWAGQRGLELRLKDRWRPRPKSGTGGPLGPRIGVRRSRCIASAERGTYFSKKFCTLGYEVKEGTQTKSKWIIHTAIESFISPLRTHCELWARCQVFINVLLLDPLDNSMKWLLLNYFSLILQIWKQAPNKYRGLPKLTQPAKG